MRRIDNGTCPMDMRCRECGEKIKTGEPIAQYEDAPLEYYEHATCADRREQELAEMAWADQAEIAQAEAEGRTPKIKHDPEAESLLDIADLRRRHAEN